MDTDPKISDETFEHMIYLMSSMEEVIDPSFIPPYIIQRNDMGKMILTFWEHKLMCDYDFTSSEYTFYDEISYSAALLLM